jgi:hypothetical protein
MSCVCCAEELGNRDESQNTEGEGNNPLNRQSQELLNFPSSCKHDV